MSQRRSFWPRARISPTTPGWRITSASKPIPPATGAGRAAIRHGLSELPYHLTQAARYEEVYQTLTDFKFLEHKAAEVGVLERKDEKGNLVKTYTGVLQLQEDYELALAAMPGRKAGLAEAAGATARR